MAKKSDISKIDLPSLAVDLTLVGLIGFVGYKLYDAFNGGYTDSSLRACKIPKRSLSYEKPVLRAFADQFYSAMWKVYNVWAEDDETAAAVLMAMNNNADVQQLICYYDSRTADSTLDALLFQEYNLLETANLYLDSYYKQLVNADWASKGIEYVIH